MIVIRPVAVEDKAKEVEVLNCGLEIDGGAIE